jgi:LPXTG-motif cell wall-anchored protein
MKTRLLAVLLVSTLVLATAAPLALAQATAGNGQATAGGDQATAGNDRDNGNADITIVDCSQVQNAFGSQGQYGNASAQYRGDAIAVVSQELNISQNQVNACLGDRPDDGNNDDANNDDANNEDEDANAEATELKDGEEEVLAGTDPGGTLPKTGGPSLLAVTLGAALIVGGATLIRFRR